MMREWTDSLPRAQAEDIWRRQKHENMLRRVTAIEDDLNEEIASSGTPPAGFYEAMKHFIALRDTLFPTLPIDPAWNILVTLASTPEGSTRASVTSIAYGAGVPLTTALRYIAAMEVEGIVRRVTDPDDLRRSIIQLTEEGQRRLDVIAGRWKIRGLIALMATPIVLDAVIRWFWVA